VTSLGRAKEWSSLDKCDILRDIELASGRMVAFISFLCGRIPKKDTLHSSWIKFIPRGFGNMNEGNTPKYSKRKSGVEIRVRKVCSEARKGTLLV